MEKEDLRQSYKEIPKEFLEDTIKYLNENKGY